MLQASFFQDSNPTQVARALLGCYLLSEIGGIRTVGQIMETEAYWGTDDKACHAYGGRKTARTQVMYLSGGHAYVTLIYGMHTMFNVVTGMEGEPQAVLIRALKPIKGIEQMLQRRQLRVVKPQLTAGPGVLTKAMGITTRLHGHLLTQKDSPVWLENRGDQVTEKNIMTGPRIGIGYAEEWIDKPWRFWVKNSEWVSKGA